MQGCRYRGEKGDDSQGPQQQLAPGAWIH